MFPLKRLLPHALVIVVAFITFSNCFHCGFHYDDANIITEGEFIKNPGIFLDKNMWMNPNYRVVSLVTFAFDYHFWKLDVVGYHLTSLLFHCIVSLLVLVLASIILRRTTSFKEREITFLGLFAALIFAVHPLQTQAVVYIVQRMSILSALFYIISLLFYYYARKAFDQRKPLIYLPLAVMLGISFYLALFSKQNAVTLPLSLILAEVFLLRNQDGKINKLFFWGILSGIFAIVTMMVATNALPVATQGITRSMYLISQFRAYLYYISRVLCPVDLNLDPAVYFNTSVWHLEEMLGIDVIIGLITASVLCFKNHKPVSFGIWWMMSCLMLESSIIPIDDPIVEHRMYLPMAGLSVSIVYCIFIIIKKLETRIQIAICSMLLCVLMAISLVRNRVWRTDITLWSEEVSHNPDNFRSYNNLGYTYLCNNQIDSADKYITRALLEIPESAFGVNNMGELMLKKGDTARAKYYFHMATKRFNYYYSMNNLALVYLAEGNITKADSYVGKSMQARTSCAKTYYITGLVRQRQDKAQEASYYFARARELNPDMKVN